MPTDRIEPTPKLVLVVDDDDDLAETLVMLLEAEGFRTLRASTGKGALAMAAAEHVDAALLDHMLPDLSGAEVGLALRASAATRDIPILMYTSTPEAIVRPVFDGYDAFLSKPVLHDRLADELKRAFASRP